MHCNDADNYSLLHVFCLLVFSLKAPPSSRYNATLGHKVNHSFEPNSEFVLFSAHPILGTVMALAAMEDMLPGQELTVNYG